MFLDSGVNTAGFDVWHFMETMFGAGVVLLVYVLTVRREDKRRQEEMHEQNRVFMQDLKMGQADIKSDMEILPLHGHTERSGALTAEGIYRPSNGKR